MSNYYISNAGDNSNLGTSELAPWETIAKVNGESFSAGDSILFNKGDNWRETMTIAASGTSGSRITIGSYGTGADPLINGADLVTTWSQYLATNIYSASCNWIPNILAEDDTILVFVVWDTDIATTAAAMSASTWTLDTTNDLVYVWASDNADPDTHTMDVGTRLYGINIANYDYIIVENLELKYLGIDYSAGVYITETGTYNIVQNCTIHGCGMGETDGMGNGIWCLGSYNTFKYNTIYDCRHNCININAHQDTADLVGNVIEHNTLYDAHHNLIDLKGSTGKTTSIRDTIVRYNTLYFSGAYVAIEGNSNGIFIRGNSAPVTTVTNTNIYYNVFYDIEECCIRTNERTDTLYIYNNVFYNSGDYHIMFAHAGDVGEDFTGEIINNIGHTASTGVLRIDDSANKTVNYNCWYNSSFVANVNGTGYTNFATYQAGTGFDSASIIQDPLFVDAANNDFHLKKSSPCRNMGTDVGLTQDYDGRQVHQPSDIGAYEIIGKMTPMKFIERLRK